MTTCLKKNPSIHLILTKSAFLIFNAYLHINHAGITGYHCGNSNVWRQEFSQRGGLRSSCALRNSTTVEGVNTYYVCQQSMYKENRSYIQSTYMNNFGTFYGRSVGEKSKRNAEVDAGSKSFGRSFHRNDIDRILLKT